MRPKLVNLLIALSLIVSLILPAVPLSAASGPGPTPTPTPAPTPTPTPTASKSSVARTDVSGLVSTNTTWTLANSPYIVTGSTLVMPGVTLTIEPGVVVKFDSARGLQVDGTLVARGTAAAPIVFTSSNATPAAGQWSYVLFSDSSGDAVFDGSGNYVSGSILQYCNISYAGSSGVLGAVQINSASPFIDRSEIANNAAAGIHATNTNQLRISYSSIHHNTSNVRGGGIAIEGNSATVTGSTVSNNTSGGSYGSVSGGGGGIYVTGSSIVITNNTVAGNTGRVSVTYAAGPAGGIYAEGSTGSVVTVSGNTITGNTSYSYNDGSGVGGLFASGGTVNVISNTVDNNTGASGFGPIGGISASGTALSFTNNTITNNRGGVDARGNGFGGVAVSGNGGTVANNTIVSNRGPGIGGILVGGTLNVTNNTIRDNIANGSSDYYGRNGGGVWISQDATVTLSNNVISGNSCASGAGGGIAVGGTGSPTGNITITGNTVSNNNSNATAGGISVAGGTVSITNNVILGNTAAAPPLTSAVHITGGNTGSRLQSNTITQNGSLRAIYANNTNWTISNNNIESNGATYSLYYDGANGTILNAQNNWWGTASATEVQNKIYDFLDDATKGIVNYSPYLIGRDPSAPPTSTPTLLSIAVTPVSATISVGQAQQFTATGTYSDNSTATLTTSVTWASTNPAVATIGASTGLATALAVGTTAVTATLGAVVSGSTTLTVTDSLLVSIAVTPVNHTISVGQTQQFTATGTYSNMTTANITAVVTWASSNTTVATINAAGLAQSIGTGSTTIAATVVGITSSTLLTVASGPTPTPTPTPTALFVSALSEGTRFDAISSGIYRFTIVGGASEVCPPASQPSHPEWWGWKTQVYVYRNRVVEWGGGANAPEHPNPTNWDFTVGDQTLRPTYQQAEQVGIGMFVDVALVQNEYVVLVVNDSRGYFNDNSGGVNFSIAWRDRVIPFVSDRTGNLEIYTMDINGNNETQLTSNPAFDNMPALSPDGTKIAFVSNRDGNREIYVMNVNGTDQRRITTNSTQDVWPSWSPDGTKLAFTSNREGNDEIYVMNADGTSPVRLTNSAGVDRFPAWSPDGSRIVFGSGRDLPQNQGLDLWVMNADGTNPVRLTNNLVTDRFASWSPDSTKLAFETDRDGNMEIYVMNADGSNPVNTTNNTASDFHPYWVPNTNKIVFTSTRDGNPAVYVMNTDGSGQTPLTDNTSRSFSRGVWIAPAATTVGFSNLTDTGVTLSGNVTSLGTADSVVAYFELGATTGYGNRTAGQAMSTLGQFSANVTGLSPGTTYHFRARADGDGGGWGANRTFTTLAGTTVSDDFNDNAINRSLWAAFEVGTGSSIAETNQRLEITLPPDSRDDPGWDQFGAAYVSRFGLRGDFDVQVDYQLLTWPPANGVRVGLTGSFGTTERTSLGNPANDWPGQPREVYLTNFVAQPPPTVTSTPTSDLSGKLRVVRSGGTATGYYWGSGGWVAIHEGPASTADTSINLAAWSHDRVFTDQQVKVAFDNFVVNQGLIVSQTPKADLIVSEKGEQWVNPAAGTYTVSYTLKNIGNATVPAGHDVRLTVDSVTIEEKAVSVTIAPGATYSDNFTTVVTLSGSSDTVAVRTDANNEVAEWDGNNNTRTNTWWASGTSLGAISGHAYLPGGIPAEGAYVRVTNFSGTTQFYGEIAVAADGSYSVGGLPTGQYAVYARNAGYAGKWYNNTYYRTDATGVSVTAPNTVANVDFMLAEPGGSISGRVYQPDGTTPLASALVQVYDFASLSSRWMQYFGTRTGSDGSYTILGLPVGQYAVRASATGYATEWYNDTHNPYLSTAVSLSPGGTTPNINFTLALGGTISGRVLGSDNVTAISGATVSAYEFGPLNASGRYISYGSATTATDGTYRIEGLPAGQYAVRANASGYILEWWDATYNQFQAAPVSVTVPVDTPNINFNLDTGGTISGFVYQPNGTTPVAGATLDFFDYTTLSGKWVSYGAVYTGTDGSYRSAPLPAGQYGMRVRASGYATEWHSDTYFKDRATAVAVGTSGDNPGINFTLASGGSISGRVFQPDNVTPIGNLQVQVTDNATRLYVNGVYTGSQGRYTLSGLPSGSYLVRAQPSTTGLPYVNQYFDNTYFQSQATPVPVNAPNDTPNINFSLAAGGRISGRILQSDNVTPVAGASVNVYLFSSLSGDLVSYSGTSTGSDGTYQTQALPTGHYAIRVSATGFATEWYSDAYSRLQALPVAVGAPNDTGNINFTLEPGGSISATVRNADGSATLGSVGVETRRTVDAGSRDWFTTTTDSSGNYSIRGLPYGDYRVRSPGGGRWAANDGNLVTEYYNNRTNEKEADLVTVSSNSTPTGINFTLASGGSVSGRVLQSDNVTPIANVHVYATDNATRMWVAGTNTNSDGYYTLRGVPVGSHIVRAYPPNNGLNYVSKWYNNVFATNLATPVPVAAGVDTPGINFSLERGGSISGRVTLAEGGAPFGGAIVSADPMASGYYGITAYTLADGSYTISGLAAGTPYRVRVSAAGYIQEYYNNVYYYNDATPVTVTTDGNTPNINFSLDRGGSISGFVYRSDGATPVPGAKVLAHSSYGGSGAVSAPDGSYTIAALPAGQYRVYAISPGYVREYYNNVSSYSAATLVSVVAPANTGNINFTLDAGGSITGRVVRSSDNTTIQNAKVTAYLVGGDTYSMRLPAAPDSPLRPQEPYGGTTGTPGEAFAKRLIGQSRAEAERSAITASGEITGEPAGGSLSETGTRAPVGADGTYTISGLPSGQYRVRAFADGYISEYYQNVYDYNSATLVSVTAPNTTSSIDFALGTGGSISGRVFLSDNVTPVVGQNVYAVHSTTGEWMASGTTDDLGSYAIIGLHAGSYLARAQPASSTGLVSKWYNNAILQAEATPVPVTPPADTPNINFRLDMGGSISGRVFRSDGTSPLSGTHVSADVLGGGYGMGATTAADGSYTIRGLPAGQYRVRAGNTGYVTEYYNNTSDYNIATPVTVTPPADTPGINFTLDIGGSISGRILRSDNVTPIAGAWAQAYWLNGSYAGSASTGGNGSYIITGLPAGQYRVTAGAEGYITEYYSGTYSSTNATPVNVTVPNDTPGIDFTLDVGGTISGRVIATAGGAPVADAYVAAYRATPDYGYGRGTRVAADGTYTVGGLPPGQYRVYVSATGYIREYYNNVYLYASATSVNVTAPGNTPNIDFSLEVGGSISGRVTTLRSGASVVTGGGGGGGGGSGGGDAPAPVAGVHIYATDNATGQWMSGANSNSDGSYTLTGLLTGSYRLRAYPSGSRLPYMDQFYNAKYAYDHADLVPVTLPNDTPGINFVLEPQVTRPTPEAAIADGIAWLASQQNPDGSWGANYALAKTALSVLKLADYAREQGISPLALAYPYHDNVTAGLNFIFSRAGSVTINTQPAGNPDGNGNGLGVFFNEPDLGHGEAGRPLYNTAIALMAIAATGEPSRVVSVPGSPVNGRTFAQVAQDTVDYIAWAQTDSGYGRGGWNYAPMNNAGTRSDQSNSGWVTLALAYAEAPVPSGMGIAIPGFVRSELNVWIDYIQNDVNGDPEDGGADYEGPGGTHSMWVNTLKTGNLLQQMAFVGDTASTPRVRAAVDYLVRHWGEGYDPGWRGTPTCYHSTYTIMKGLEALNIDTIGPFNWFQDFTTAILREQSGAGWFPVSRWDDGERILSTTWALLTLEKAIPPTREGPDLVVTEKRETWVSESAGTYRVQFTIKNQGNAPAPAGHDVRLTVDNVTVEEKAVPFALGPGVTFSDNFSTTATMSGSFDTVAVTADANREVTELNEENNTVSNVWSGAPPLQPGPAQAQRVLPTRVSRSQTFDVRITFVAPGNGFNAIGVADLAPSGWNVTVDPQQCTPPADTSQTSGNRADYIWFGPYVQGTAFTAVYQVTVPSGAPLGPYRFGSGRLEYYLGGSGPYAEAVAGNTLVTVSEGARVEGVTYEAKGVALPGVTVTLDGTTPVLSDTNGNYNLTVGTLGTHTFVAGKSGYRSQTRTLNVTDVAATYTLNFRGIYGLVPNAPDMSYVLACINKWKFPPNPELGLDLSKVLAVINAWKFPITTPTPAPTTTTPPTPTTQP